MILAAFARKTVPEPASVGGAEGMLLRLEACDDPDARAAYARVLRSCATGHALSDTVAWRDLAPHTLLALGVLVGMLGGLLLGAASVTRPPAAHVIVRDEVTAPASVFDERADVETLPLCEDERPGPWTGALCPASP